MTPRRVLALVVALVLIAGGAGGYLWWDQQRQARDLDRGAEAAFTSLAARWTAKDVTTGVRFADPAQTKTFATTLSGLGKAAQPKATVTTSHRDGTAATATLAVSWTLAPGVVWAYDVPARAAYDGTTWAISTPASGSQWVPGIKADDTVALNRVWGDRGDLLDGSGTPLAPIGDVYPVSLDPTRATPTVAADLEKLTDQPAGSLVKALAAATTSGSKAPIPVITYRQSDFEALQKRLDALKGVIYPRTEQPLAKTRTFLQPLLGSFGAVTKELVDASKGRLVAGDRAGLSGLQGHYDSTLGGTPGLTVTSNTGKELFSKDPVDGKNVKTSLKPDVQDAAEAAVASTGKVPSALVAVDVTSGNVLAVANNPTYGFDRADTGQYPPGSTMKIATMYALLSGKVLSPTDRVTCPKTITVDGRSFRNFEGEELGNPTVEDNFVHSCNTAFIQMAAKLPADGVSKAATALGLGGDWAASSGIPGAYAGSVPPSNGKTDHAAGAIGQGRDLSSPLAMAGLAADVARGSTLGPRLVQDGDAPTPTALDATAVSQLQGMMRKVVTSGTGSALKGVPGGAVSAKTGTAEYGDATKNRAWIVGYQGSVAFAVLVEDGSSGGAVAGPVAAKFLSALHS